VKATRKERIFIFGLRAFVAGPLTVPRHLYALNPALVPTGPACRHPQWPPGRNRGSGEVLSGVPFFPER
jgi:hypothetical protein